MLTVDSVFSTQRVDLSGYTSQQLINYEQFTDVDLFGVFMLVDSNNADCWYENPRQRQGGVIVDNNTQAEVITKDGRKVRVAELCQFYSKRTGAFCCTPKCLFPVLTPEQVSY